MATVQFLVVMAITLSLIYNFGCNGYPTTQKPTNTHTSTIYVEEQLFDNGQGAFFQQLPNKQPDSLNSHRGRSNKTDEIDSNTETEEQHENSSSSGMGIGMLGHSIASIGTSKSNNKKKWTVRNHKSKTNTSEHSLNVGEENKDTDKNEETELESENEDSKKTGLNVGIFGREAASFGTKHSSSSHDFSKTTHQSRQRTKFAFTTENSSFDHVFSS